MKPLLSASVLWLAPALALAQTAEPVSPPPAESSPPAASAPAASSWTDKVKLSAKAYLRYSYELGQEAKNSNQFNIDRIYLQSEYFATDKVRFQLTLDSGVTRNASGNQVFLAETKSAFIEVKDLVAKGLYLRAGILPLAWIPYEEELWGYRVQGPLPMDRWGYITSADIGLAVGGSLPSKYGSFQVNLTDGEGFRFSELGKRKEVQARLTVNPLASMGGLASGVFVTGYGSFGEYDDTGLAARAKSRVIGEVGFQSAPLTVAGAYAVARDSQPKVKGRYTVGDENLVTGHGLYGFAIVNVGELSHAPVMEGVDVVARYDHLEPDRVVENDTLNLLIAGVGYRWNKNIRSIADYETVSYGADVGGVGTHKPAEKRLKLQTEFKF